MKPVDIIHLNLHEIPTYTTFIVPFEHGIEHFDITMIGKTEITYTSSFSLPDQEIENAVVHISFVKVIHASVADSMKKHIIDIVGLEILQRIIIHLDRFLPGPCLRCEIRKFRGYEIAVARMPCKSISCDLLALSAAIGG